MRSSPGLISAVKEGISAAVLPSPAPSPRQQKEQKTTSFLMRVAQRDKYPYESDCVEHNSEPIRYGRGVEEMPEKSATE